MNVMRAASIGFATAIASAWLPAQSAGEPLARRVASEVAGVVAEPGGHLGLGRDYRVHFAPDAVRFVPALGANADRNHPVAFRYSGIRRGDDVRVDATGDVPPPGIERDVVTFARSDQVVERWHVGPAGVELTYKLERPVRGAGDLIVSLDVETDLPLLESDPIEGARFAIAGVGGVRIGGVTAIDARGERVRGELRATDGAIDLVVPSAFVARAAYPLVIDPLIGTDRVISTPGQDDALPDVAYDADNDVYLFVWAREYSASDVRIMAMRTDSTGNAVGSLIQVRGGSVSLAPSVGNSNAVDQFVVAWQEAPTIFGPWDIYVACVDAATGAVSAAIPIAATTASEVTPDVGCSENPIKPGVPVVWVGGGIQIAMVSCNPGGTPTSTGVVTLSPSSVPSKLSVSNGGGSLNRYLVVWDELFGGIRAALVTSALTVVETGFFVAPGITATGGPSVDGDGTNFLVVWDRYESSATAGERDVFGAKVSYNGSSLTASPLFGIADTSGWDERDPTVAFLGYKYAVAWAEAQAQPANLTYDVHLLTFDPIKCVPCGTEITISGGGFGYDGNPEIGPKLAAAPSAGDEAMLAFASIDSSAPYTAEVWGQPIEAVGSGGAVTNAGGACGVPGTAGFLPGVGQPVAIGNTDFGFQLSNADTKVHTAVLVLGLTTTTFPCGSCVLVNPLASAAVSVSSGTASIPLPLACDLSVVGGQFAFQFWMVGAGTSPCSLLPGVSATDVVNVTMGF